MAGSIALPPVLSRLLCLLEKPNTVAIAEKMVTRLLNKPIKTESSRDRYPDCACAVVKKTLTTDTVGHEFHRSDVLRFLAAPLLHVTTDCDSIECVKSNDTLTLNFVCSIFRAPRLLHFPQLIY